MESVLTKLLGSWDASGRLSTCASIIGMFTYTILLDRDFACSCEGQAGFCSAYLLLPVFIILLLTLWTNRSLHRVCRCPCLLPRCSFCRHIIEALLVGVLWIVFVFIDGDWYICCLNDHSEQQAGLACKPAAKITEKEQAMTADLKNRSRLIGGVLLLCIISVAFLMSLCRSCEKSRRFLYHQLILEQEENVLKEILGKSAKEQLTEEITDKIRGEHWEESFHVARELIEASTKPEIHEEDGRRRQQGARATRKQLAAVGQTSAAATAAQAEEIELQSKEAEPDTSLHADTDTRRKDTD